MELVKNIFSSGLGMGTGAISDTVVRSFNTLFRLHAETHFLSQKLVVIGGTVETARRVASSSWNSFVDCMPYPFAAVSNKH